MGLTGVKRCDSLNDSPVFIRALADLAAAHLKDGASTSPQMLLRCPNCTNATCGQAKSFFAAGGRVAQIGDESTAPAARA